MENFSYMREEGVFGVGAQYMMAVADLVQGAAQPAGQALVRRQPKICAMWSALSRQQAQSRRSARRACGWESCA